MLVLPTSILHARIRIITITKGHTGERSKKTAIIIFSLTHVYPHMKRLNFLSHCCITFPCQFLDKLMQNFQANCILICNKLLLFQLLTLPWSISVACFPRMFREVVHSHPQRKQTGLCKTVLCIAPHLASLYCGVPLRYLVCKVDSLAWGWPKTKADKSLKNQ